MAVKRKKTVAKKTKKKTKNTSLLGTVTHYFDKINVAVVKLVQSLKVGAYVEFRHDNDSFAQFVESMQINHKAITGAKAKSEIGLKVAKPVKVGWVMLKAHQPTLMESIPKKEGSKGYSYSPIFPGVKSEPKPIEQKPAPVPQPPAPKPPIPSGPQKKTGYGEVKFFKF